MTKRLAEDVPTLLDNVELPVVKGKITTIIKCQEKGCALYRKIYTSDKHQVKYCRLHQRKSRSRQTVTYRKQVAAAKPKTKKVNKSAAKKTASAKKSKSKK